MHSLLLRLMAGSRQFPLLFAGDFYSGEDGGSDHETQDHRY